MTTILAEPASFLSGGPNCGYCGNELSPLAPCRRCRFIQYCSEEHESLHRDEHARHCERLAETNEALKNLCGDLPPTCHAVAAVGDPFLTKAFANPRRDMIRYMEAIKSQSGAMVQEILSCLRENMEAAERYSGLFHSPQHYAVQPGLLIQLGRDQEAFDTVKGWTEGNLGYTDAWEYPDTYALTALRSCHLRIFSRGFSPVNAAHSVALVLLKVRILLDLQRLAVTARILAHGRLPLEIIDHIGAYIPWSSTVAKNRGLTRIGASGWLGMALRELIEEMQCQVRALGREISRRRPCTWAVLLDMKAYIDNWPDAQENREQALEETMERLSYDAWKQTPGAIDLMQELADNGDLGEKTRTATGIRYCVRGREG